MFYVLLVLFGIVVGVLSGLLGIGGGVALVPGLVLLFGFKQVEAQGTSLAALMPPVTIFAAIVYYQHGFVRPGVVASLAVGVMLGAFFGAKLVPLISPSLMRTVFGILLVYMGYMLVFLPRGTKPSAVLPQALAALATVLLARLLRRNPPPPRSWPPPSDQIDYHI